MDINETMRIITQIKMFRPMFLYNMSDEKVLELADEWTRARLQYYDYEDVRTELYKYLEDRNNQNSTPDPFAITRNILKKEDKGKEILGLAECSICRNKMPYNYVRDHEDRCRSIRYLQKVYKQYFEKELEASIDLYEMKEPEFHKKYMEVLEKAYPMMEDSTIHPEKTLVGRLLGYDQ